MLEGGWLQVLQRIPPEYQDTLSLISVTGAELVVQQLFKIEGDFLVVRARTAGSLNEGRLIIVPYSQIDFLAFNRKIAEPEVMAMFGAPFQPMSVGVPAAGTAAAPPTIPVIPVVTPSVEAVPPAETPVEAEAAEKPPEKTQLKPGQISKSILLARLRERLAEKAK